MQHKVKLTVIDKKLYPELQQQYCKDPNSGMCPCYNVGDAFIFERYDIKDDFWHMGLHTLKQTSNKEHDTAIAGGRLIPHCSEAWDAISRYIYTGLQGGSIMRGWMNDERVMIACCSDGTRPVIFKIERMDYKVVYIEEENKDKDKLKEILEKIENVINIELKDNYMEVFISQDVTDDVIKNAIENYSDYHVRKIE